MHFVSFQKAVEPNTRAQTSMEPHVACRKARFRVPCQLGGRYVTLASFKVYLTNCTGYKKLVLIHTRSGHQHSPEA